MKLLWLLPVALLCSAEKARDWQAGKLVDAERSQYQAGTRGSVNEYGSPGYSESTVYHKVQTLAIEGSEYFYVVQEETGGPHLSLLPPKLTNLTVNAPVRYAIEKQKLYVIADDGKEHKFDIVKRVLKPKP
jgi:hypothetical protein